MIAARIFCSLLLCTLPCAGADESSPITSSAIAAGTSDAAIAAARARGAATARRDIEAGILRILYYGLPWAADRPLVDESTGYRVQVVGGCVVSEPFTTEVEAYNNAVRHWHAKGSGRNAKSSN